MDTSNNVDVTGTILSGFVSASKNPNVDLLSNVAIICGDVSQAPSSDQYILQLHGELPKNDRLMKNVKIITQILTLNERGVLGVLIDNICVSFNKTIEIKKATNSHLPYIATKLMGYIRQYNALDELLTNRDLMELFEISLDNFSQLEIREYSASHHGYNIVNDRLVDASQPKPEAKPVNKSEAKQEAKQEAKSNKKAK